MKEKVITICDKPAGLAYCFATEMNFVKATGISIEQASISTPEHIVALIVAAHIAYCMAHQQPDEVTVEKLVYDAKPAEIQQALNEVLRMRMEWYEIPQAEIDATTAKLRGDDKKPKGRKKKKDDPKNA